MKTKTKRILKRIAWGVLGLLVLLGIGATIILNQPSFGKLPSGTRLERMKQSPNYREGKFQNLKPTPILTSDKSVFQVWISSITQKVKDLIPVRELPSIKTDLKSLDPNEDMLIWMGHSSLYLQTSGKRILIDPVLISASPFSFFNKAFKGTDHYTPEDMPEIDYLLVTHDHWDHLDYNTMLKIKDRVQKVICPLGVGAHFEYWGFEPQKIMEVDWEDTLQLDDKIKLTALPARHFSGRGLTSNQSLWTAYMLQCSLGNVFISGDTGYDTHFGDIKNQFGTIDFAIMENGQYNEDWKYIHMLPEDLIKAVKDLQPIKVMTVHNSKYALAQHAWYEPLEDIAKASKQHQFNLITPMIGEPVHFKDSLQTFHNWWK